MKHIQLTVPAPDYAENPNTITNIQQLRKWIDHLPYANPIGTGKLLLKSLSLLNRHPQALGNRAQLMACYLTPFYTLITSARSREAAQARRSEAKLYALTEKIIVEMTYGFKKAINETALKQKSWLRPANLSTLLYFALESLTLEMMFSFFEYHLEPENAWQEILQIYLLSERLGVSHERINDPTIPGENRANIHLSFKRILLIRLLDPFRLEQSEVWQVFDYLARWGDKTRITKIPASIDRSSGRFRVDLHSLEKPRPLDPENLPGNTTRYLMLDVTQLNALINRHIQSLDSDNPEQIPGTEEQNKASMLRMFRHMLLAWHLQPKRRHPREERFEWLVTACGITDVSHFLNEGKLAASSQALQDDESVEILDIMRPSLPVNHNTFRWRQTNISESGVGLEMSPDDAKSLHVGQIVLTESEQISGDEKWTAGVVRRLILRDNSTMVAGIQFIQGHISSAKIRPLAPGHSENSDPLSALMLDRGNNIPGVLFTPCRIYQANREYIVETADGRTLHLVANKLLESTNHFERFEYHSNL